MRGGGDPSLPDPPVRGGRDPALSKRTEQLFFRSRTDQSEWERSRFQRFSKVPGFVWT